MIATYNREYKCHFNVFNCLKDIKKQKALGALPLENPLALCPRPQAALPTRPLRYCFFAYKTQSFSTKGTLVKVPNMDIS